MIVTVEKISTDTHNLTLVAPCKEIHNRIYVVICASSANFDRGEGVIMRYTATPKDVQWQDLSKQHKDVRERLKMFLEEFIRGNSVPPIAIVGPYGSGKSELMCWGFREVWKEYKIPAFMVHLEKLLKEIPDNINPNELVEILANIVKTQIDKLQELMDSEQTIPPEIYLPDRMSGETLTGYFGEIYKDTFNLADFKKTLQTGKAVLFIDEMEQKYSELLQKVKVSDKAPLREVLESVEKRLAPYYLVMSFGLTSAYETLSGADARREHTIYVSLPTPKNFACIMENSQATNLLWWASRGRPGWGIKFESEWKDNLKNSTTLEEMRTTFGEMIESLPAVDIARLGTISNSKTTASLKQLLVQLQPIEASKLGVHSIVDFLNSLQHFLFVAKELSSVDDILDAFMNDLNIPNDVDCVLLSDYIRKILESVANQEQMLAFGGWRDLGNTFAKGAVIPLLILLHDMILEFEGDSNDGQKTLEFLYAVMNNLGITEETVPDKAIWEVQCKFPKTHEIFCQNNIRDENEVNYLQFSFHTIENLFPRLVVRPFLLLHQGAKRDLQSQKNDLEGSIRESKRFFRSTFQQDEFEVDFLLTTKNLVDTIQSCFFSPQQQESYLPHKKLFIVLNLDGNSFQLDVNQNSEISILDQLGKIRCNPLSEKRLSDFLLSLCYNVISWDETKQWDDFRQAIQELSSGKKFTIPKTASRTIEHYQSRIQEYLSKLASEAVKNYRNNLKESFSLTDFPVDRIKDFYAQIKEARTVELIACAFDLDFKRESSLNCLAQLRDMKKLQEKLPTGHGYKNFFEHYSVIEKAPRLKPSTGMNEIVEYIHKNNGFSFLKKMANGLSFNPNATLEHLENSIANNPLELMFNDSAEQKYFLRGCFLASFLENRQEELVKMVRQLTTDLSKTQEGFGRLKGEIDTLNQQAGRSILSDTNVNQYVKELTAACKLLESPQEIPPSILYVAYQFLKASQKQVEELRQRWAGEKGIKGWNNQLCEILGLKDYLEHIEKDLDEIYNLHAELKENVLGSRETYSKEIQQKMQEAKEKIFTNISHYELGDDIPAIDMDEVEEEKAGIQEKIENMRERSQTIDQAVGALSEIKTPLEKLCKLMGEGRRF
ncbi:MAG: hypothetical protein ABIJ30_10640 [bacterium]